MKILPAYTTGLGAAYCSDSLKFLGELPDQSVALCVTSPPFALLRQKEYGNKGQEEYIDWILEFASIVHAKLADNGSFVIDLGGAYTKGLPVRSLYNFRLLIRLCDEIGFYLAEDFYWFNPSKLPSPIEWVNKRKIRAKDSVNTVWWLSKSQWPKADVTKVLSEYSERMKTLLKDPSKFYSPKKRPSGHDISEGFGKDNGGSIPSNLLQIPNSGSNGKYQSACNLIGIKPHPATFPEKLPQFFIKFLTDPGDLVVDIFAGSNTTGHAAEIENRRWIAIEEKIEYLAASVFRFLDENDSVQLRSIYDKICSGKNFEIKSTIKQQNLFEE